MPGSTPGAWEEIALQSLNGSIVNAALYFDSNDNAVVLAAGFGGTVGKFVRQSGVWQSVQAWTETGSPTANGLYYASFAPNVAGTDHALVLQKVGGSYNLL